MKQYSNSSPIFIGGLYRSGTSLLRAMLGRHSNIAAGLETFWFDLDFSGKATCGRIIRNWDGTRTEPLQDHVTRLAKFFDMDASRAILLAGRCSSAEEFTDLFMAEYAAGQGKKRWAEKTPANVLHIERIFSFWPGAKFIHVARDPRDVYSSLKRTGKWTRPEDFAGLWIKFISAHAQAGKYAPSMLEIRYEDLVLEPEKTMRSVLDFVREPWEKETALFPGEPGDLQKVQKLTGKSSTTLEQLGRPLAAGRVGAWKQELHEPEDVLKIEEVIRAKGLGQIWEGYKFGG